MKSAEAKATSSIVLRAEASDLIPDTLAFTLTKLGKRCGFIRGSGLVEELEIRAAAAQGGALGRVRTIQGQVQAIVLEGAFGQSGDSLVCNLRGLFAREGDTGLEVFAGELVSARAIAVELLATCLDDLDLPREFDEDLGTRLFSIGASAAAAHQPQGTPEGPRPVATWNDATLVSQNIEPPKKPTSLPTSGAKPGPTPPRPVRPEQTEVDSIYPEVGDTAEHFAFGLCDVVKSDGDRLHLKVIRDGRVKEIATAMLKMTLMGEIEGHKRFKFDRRI